jgi:hypothetical protein
VSRPYKTETCDDRNTITTVFDMSTGIKLLEVFDHVVNKTTFIRKFKNTKLSIKNNKVISISTDIKLDKIINIFGKLSSKQAWVPNPNFGVLDIETYKDTDGLSKTYAIGFETLLEKIPHTFYLTDISSTLDSNYLIIHCIDSMLVSKYHNYTFFVHNLGKYDVVFIYKVLKEFNLHKQEEYYIMKTIFRDDVMLKLTISIKLSKKKYIKITLVDSLNILNEDLETLAEDFEIDDSKGFFPYSFVTKDRLNYIGLAPNMSHYKFESFAEYSEKVCVKEVLNLKEEAIKYLEKDLKILLLVLEKFSTSLFTDYNL